VTAVVVRFYHAEALYHAAAVGGNPNLTTIQPAQAQSCLKMLISVDFLCLCAMICQLFLPLDLTAVHRLFASVMAFGKAAHKRIIMADAGKLRLTKVDLALPPTTKSAQSDGWTR
jgi:hypothetical protein